MRNHAPLYVLRPDGEPGEFEALGEANSALPIVWRLLFAHTAALPAVAHVLGRGAQRLLAVDAHEAVARYQHVAHWLLEQPLIAHDSEVSRYLRALEQHLLERTAAWVLPDLAAPVFAVDLHEFGATPEAVHNACATWWRAFEEAHTARQPDALERLFAMVGKHPMPEWRAWSETFGFALFAHPFFAEAFRAPVSGEWKPHPDPVSMSEQTQWPVVNGCAVVLENERYGYVDAQGRVLVPPQFDAADDFTPARVARVCKQRRYGLLRADGTYAAQPTYEELEWHEDLQAWIGRRLQRAELLYADGRAWLEGVWTHIEPLEAHDELQASARASHCVRVWSAPQRSRPKAGIWDLQRNTLLVPCEYDFIWLTLLGPGDRYGFLVANKLPYADKQTERYRVGLCDVSGQVLVPADYAWLGVCADLSKSGAFRPVREALYWAWSRGAPVAAGLPNGDCVWIAPNQRVVSGAHPQDVARLRTPASPASPMSAFIAAAFYKFVTLPDYRQLREPLREYCDARGVKGTILLAEEGINGTIAGAPQAVREVLTYLRGDPRLVDLEHKESPANELPFYRMKVRLKREIVTMGVPQANAAAMAGTYVEPRDWNALIDDPQVVVIDARNDYEVQLGTFKGAINPKTRSFRELPQWLREQETLKHKPKVAMFCTGGIRCEKSTAFLRSEGFEHVYHLKGGILKYLETVPQEQSRWQGDCFVFDERVGIGHGLKLSDHELCRSCREPIGAAEKASEFYIAGVSCPKCHHLRSDEKKRGLQERQRQVELAKQRQDQHIGVRQELRKKG